MKVWSKCYHHHVLAAEQSQTKFASTLIWSLLMLCHLLYQTNLDTKTLHVSDILQRRHCIRHLLPGSHVLLEKYYGIVMQKYAATESVPNSFCRTNVQLSLCKIESFDILCKWSEKIFKPHLKRGVGWHVPVLWVNEEAKILKNVFKVGQSCSLKCSLNTSNLIGVHCYSNAITSHGVVCWDVLWIEW